MKYIKNKGEEEKNYKYFQKQMQKFHNFLETLLTCSTKVAV